MPNETKLEQAVIGCEGMKKALVTAEASARIAVDDSDFPTDCRGDMREAITAVRYAQKCIIAIQERLVKERVAPVTPGEDLGETEEKN